MELTVQNIYGLLLRSQLLPLADARQMFERWQKEARDDAANVGKFVKWMVANQHLTEYQASLLARGHTDCFFVKEYKVLDRIGRGRMAGVYKATHKLGQIVAIKVLPPSKAKDVQTLGRFQREARLALLLKHPNIVRTFQVGEANGLHFMIMECLEGETLEEVLQRRGQLPAKEAVRLVYQALLGLHHIHEQGLIHRDMKPGNLMLVSAAGVGRVANASYQPDDTLRSTVKILDIGLGRALFDENAAPSALDPDLTSEGMLLGTPDYLAPEQARDAHAADIRSDIYSLGCVLYHTLAGQPPFPDTSMISKMIRHATEQPRPLKELNAAVADNLQQVVSRMMAKDPAQRYPTPDQAGQALQPFLIAANETPPAADANPRMRAFLTWLDTENGSEQPASASQPAAARPLPAAVPVGPMKGPVPGAPVAKLVGSAATAGLPAAQPVAPALQEAESPSPDKKQRVKKEKYRPAAAPAAASAAPAPVQATFDVELVSPHASQQEAGRRRSLGLSGRDLMIMGAGAGIVLLAILAGWLLSRWFHV